MKTAVSIQLQTSFRFTITVKAGPDAGKSFQLLPPLVTLGRETENHIVLTDPKVSRHQASIEFRDDQVVLFDKSGKGKLFVNGVAVEQAILSNGDKIQAGQTELVFRMDTISVPAKQNNSLGLVPPPSMPQSVSQSMSQPVRNPTYDYQMGGAASPSYSGSSRRGDEAAKRFRFYIAVVMILGLGVWFLTQQPSGQPLDRSLRGAGKVEADIAESEKNEEIIVKQKSFKTEADRRRYEDAQGHYLQGFRDLQKGNYSRAIRAFETALAIDPSHNMAKRYFKQASRSRDEFVVQTILEGRQYKQRQMYPRCVSAMDKALGSLGEAAESDLKGKEAMALRRECQALMQDRF